MKRWLLIQVLCFSVVALQAQAVSQRLALLPIKGGGESSLLSLCLDFFRPAPSGPSGVDYKQAVDAHGKVVEGLDFNAPGYDHIAVTRRGQSATKDIKEPLYLSANSDIGGITEQKKEFIQGRYLRLRSDPTYTLPRLQDEVWAFDILETLGYIDRTEPAERAYHKGLVKFGADFLESGDTPTTRQVTEFGTALELLFHGETKAELLVLKKPVDKTLIAFNKIGPPVYTGSSTDPLAIYKGTNPTDALAGVVANMSKDGQTVEIFLSGFENDLREKAFMVELKRKVFVTHSKDIILTNSAASDVWEPRKLVVLNDPVISESASGGRTAYSSSLQVMDGNGPFATIEGMSNRRSPLKSFFTLLIEQIYAKRDQLILAKAVRSIRQSVMADMNISNGDYIDALIVTEGRYKTVVKIRNGKVQIIPDYAAGN